MWRWLIIAALPSAIWCSCAPHPSPKTAWTYAELVFVGHVERVELAPHSMRYGWIRVVEPFKGVAKNQLVETGEWDGDNEVPRYLKGDVFLFYLGRGSLAREHLWSAGICGSTGPVESRAQDLKFLRGLPGSAAGTSLLGRILLEYSTPLKGIPVKISGPAQRTTRTGDEGSYEVRGLPPGTYHVDPEVPKGMKLSLRSLGWQPNLPRTRFEVETVTLRPDEHVLCDISLRFTSSIGGRILDREGKPLGTSEVDSIHLQAADQNRLIDRTSVDSRNRYTLHSVPPGRYRVSVILAPRAPGSPSPAPVYFPETVEVTLDRPNPIVDITVPILRRNKEKRKARPLAGPGPRLLH